MSDEPMRMPGWDAINAALRTVYGEREPLHWATLIPSYLGGPDPLDGISAFKNLEPIPHWHIIGMGLSELFDKKSSDTKVSGFGYEFTFRLKCDPGDEQPPNWAFNFMQNLARAVTQHGIQFGAFHTIDANGPIATGDPTKMTAVAFVPDPKMETIDTPNGRVEFLQIVGITHDELEAMREWQSGKVLKLMADRNPLLVTDLRRASLLDDPTAAAAITKGVEKGESSGTLDVSELRWKKLILRKTVEVTIGALIVPALVKMIRRRTLRNQPFLIANDRDSIGMSVVPDNQARWEINDQLLEIRLTQSLAEEIARTLRAQRGIYSWEELPHFRIVVEPSEIRDGNGKIVETIG